MRRVAFALCILLAATSANAQVAGEAFLQQAGVSVGSGSGQIDETGRIQLLRGLAPLAVSPEANVVVIEQDGSGNTVDLSQAGSANQFLLSQTGSNLTATFAQSGVGNEATLILSGLNNTLEGIQAGNGNSYILSLSTSNTTHSLQQVGAGNVAEQIVAPGLLPASIEQRGNGARILVERR